MSSDYTKYGMCSGRCGKWIPRDLMLSINVTVYNEDNVEEKIPLRLCPECHKVERDELNFRRWTNDLKFEIEIRADKSLADNSDLEYDPSPEVERMVANAKISRTSPDRDDVFLPSIKDDSEAALRRKGVQLDVEY